MENTNVKVYLPKKVFESMSKEELQEMVNKYIKAGFMPSDTTIDDTDLEENHPELFQK